MDDTANLPAPIQAAPAEAPVRNRGGRPVGAKNALPRELRVRLRDLLENRVDDLERWLDQAAKNDPAEAARLYTGLLPYVAPRLSAVAVADISPSQLPIKERLTQARVTEEMLLSPRVGALIRSGRCQNLDDVLAELSRPDDAVTIDAQAAENDPLVR